MPSAAITNENKLTLPREIRDHLEVGFGDSVVFRVVPGGHVVVEPETLPNTAIKGIVRSPLARPVTHEEMDEAIARGAAEHAEAGRDRA